MRTLSVWQKLMVMAVAFAAPLLVTLALLDARERSAIGAARTERAGLALVDPSLDLLRHAQDHRAAAVAAAAASARAGAHIAPLEAQMAGDLARIRAASPSSGRIRSEISRS